MYRLYFILTLLFVSLGVTAQVGVNEPNPVQALDVNGKVSIGNDGAVPTDGTLRYNGTDDDFEGFADGEWKSLTKSGTPVAPRPVVYAEFGAPNDNTWNPFDRWYDYTDRPLLDRTNVEVPAGKIFVVDQICATLSSGSNMDDYFYASVRPTQRLSDGTQTNVNPQIVIAGGRKDGTTCIQTERAPLLVIENQGSIAVWNSTNSGGQIRVMVYGFYVDRVEDYFTY